MADRGTHTEQLGDSASPFGVGRSSVGSAPGSVPEEGHPSEPLCAGTDYDTDCNCGCPSMDGDPNHECDWPTCGCACKPDCVGCAMARNAGVTE